MPDAVAAAIRSTAIANIANCFMLSPPSDGIIDRLGAVYTCDAAVC